MGGDFNNEVDMNFVEYIQNGTNISGGRSTGWMINFGRYPTTGTKIEIKFKHQNSAVDGNAFFGCHKYDGTNNYFRLFTYQNNTYILDSPDDGDSRISVPVTFNQEVTLQATPAPNVSITNLNTQRTETATNGKTPDYKFPMALWYGFNGDSGEVVEGTQIFYIKIWESNVLVMDLWPAVDNGVVGLYDKIGGQMYTNTGSQKVLTTGPVLSSIVATPSKTVLANAGETINIAVVCENAWTVTGNTWLTLSSTGDTGSTTITATAPSYTGATARTDVLTFTDTTTGDEMEITIKQKKYSSGQPVYLGGNEVTELYLGGNAVSDAYLGENLVFSSGPFAGLKMPKSINFTQTKLENTIKVKASESWSFTTIPTGFTVSPTTGDSGITLVTVSTSASSANTTGTLVATSTNYIASATCNYTYGIPMLTINGIANIVTDFYPAVAYDNNGGYLKWDLCALWTGANPTMGDQYLYQCDLYLGNRFFSVERYSSYGTYMNVGTNRVSNGPTNGGGLDHTWVVVANSGIVTTYIDGVQTETASIEGSFSYNVLKFTGNSGRNFKGNFYWLKFYDQNDNLIKDFRPDPSGGIIDLVTNTLYAKTGTGTTEYSLYIPE